MDFEAILIAFGALLGEFGEQFEVEGIVWKVMLKTNQGLLFGLRSSMLSISSCTAA